MTFEFAEMGLMLVLGYAVGRGVGHWQQLSAERKWLEMFEQATKGYGAARKARALPPAATEVKGAKG